MRRGHQHHPRFAGQKKSIVSIDEVIAALRNQEFTDQKEPETPPLSPSSMDSQQSSPKFFRERLSPTIDKPKHRSSKNRRYSGNCEDYQSGSSVHSSPSNKRHSRPRSFYESPGTVKGDSPLRKSVNERLSFHQRRSDEDLTTIEKPIEKKRSSLRKSSSVDSSKVSLTPSNRASKSSETTPVKKHSKRRSIHEEKLKDDEDWSKLRCTSELSEVVAEKEKRRSKKKNPDPQDLDNIFAEAVFRSDTLMRFSIIKNELHNIQKSQLRRAELDFSSFNKRIESQENDLDAWQKDLKRTQISLTETTESMEKAKKAKDMVEEITSHDEYMKMLESRLEKIGLKIN